MTLLERCRRLGALGGLLARVPREERPILLQAVGRLSVAWLRLRFPRLLRGYALASREWAAGCVPESRVDLERVQRLAALFARVHTTLPFGVPCLPRSLALRSFLGAHGVEGVLRLGMRAEADGLRGHAWIDCGGIVPNEAGDPRETYCVFERPTYNPALEGG
jgi:hypothetical protein